MATGTEHKSATRAVAEPVDDEKLVMFLEPDQLVIDKSQPVPRAALSREAKVALWALRFFVVIVSAMVIYTFISQLAT